MDMAGTPGMVGLTPTAGRAITAGMTHGIIPAGTVGAIPITEVTGPAIGVAAIGHTTTLRYPAMTALPDGAATALAIVQTTGSVRAGARSRPVRTTACSGHATIQGTVA